MLVTDFCYRHIHVSLIIARFSATGKGVSLYVGCNRFTVTSDNEYFNTLFHRRTRTIYLYNGCLAWCNVLITSQVHSSVKSQFPKVRQTKYTAADLCDGGISVLNHCLSWSKFVNTHLSHSRQRFNICIQFCFSPNATFHVSLT